MLVSVAPIKLKHSSAWQHVHVYRKWNKVLSHTTGHRERERSYGMLHCGSRGPALNEAFSCVIFKAFYSILYIIYLI